MSFEQKVSEEKVVLDQQDTNSKQVEFDGFKNKDILTKVKEVLGSDTIPNHNIHRFNRYTTQSYHRYRQDDIDTPPQDFNQYDHIHLNAEVSD